MTTDSAAESGSVSPPLSGNATYADEGGLTEEWYQRRAAIYADDARKIVKALRDYEDCHPADAPCLMPLLDSLPNAYWRGCSTALSWRRCATCKTNPPALGTDICVVCHDAL